MASGSLARRYAKAIFAIGQANNNEQMIAKNLALLAEEMKRSVELKAVRMNPAIRRADRRRALDGLLTRFAVDTKPDAATRTTLANIVNLLLDSERLGEVPGISRELNAMIDAASGKIKVTVVSARALSSGEVDGIRVAFEKLSGKTVLLEEKDVAEDANLLGGIVAKVGDVVYDSSLRTQLRTLRDELTK